MRLAVAIALVFCAQGFGQSAPDNKTPAAPRLRLPEFNNPQPDWVKKRLEGMKLLPGPFTVWQQKVVAAEVKPSMCAIPLLNALPAVPRVDYKIETVKPSASMDRGMTPKIGIPACANWPGR